MVAPKIPRRVSRTFALQVLYGLQFSDIHDVAALKRAYNATPRQEEDSSMEDDAFAWDLVEGVFLHYEELDELIARFAHNWRLDRVGRVELCLLRLSVYEMVYRPDVPLKVAINEALELGHQFGEEKARIFLNGILDAVAKALEAGTLPVKVDKSLSQ